MLEPDPSISALLAHMHAGAADLEDATHLLSEAQAHAGKVARVLLETSTALAELTTQERQERQRAADRVLQELPPKSWWTRIKSAFSEPEVDRALMAEVVERGPIVLAEAEGKVRGLTDRVNRAKACGLWIEHASLAAEISGGMETLLGKVIQLQGLENQMRELSGPAATLPPGPDLIVPQHLLSALGRLDGDGQIYLHYRQPHLRARAEAIFAAVNDAA